MSFEIRLERPVDHLAVEAMTRAAFLRDHFFDDGAPGCDEHYLAHILRQYPAFVRELDFVAMKDGQVVGNIMYVHAKIIDVQNRAHAVLLFGPLSVLPSFQKQGIGGALLRHSLEEARKLGHRAVVIYGHPSYYPRFGFRPCAEFGIAHSDGKTFDAHMALELVQDGLSGVSGRFYVDAVYEDLQKEKVAAFDKYLRKEGVLL